MRKAIECNVLLFLRFFLTKKESTRMQGLWNEIKSLFSDAMLGHIIVVVFDQIKHLIKTPVNFFIGIYSGSST